MYIQVPPAFSSSVHKSESVSGGKSSLWVEAVSRAWFDKFHKAMVKFRFTQSDTDHIIFVKCANENISTLIVYVDDIVVTGDDPYEASSLKAQ